MADSTKEPTADGAKVVTVSSGNEATAAPPAEPLIVVFGASGAQGGGCVRALLKKGGFTVKGVTRDPEKPACKALAEAGATIVKGDLDDAAALPALFAGAYGVFLVTNFWEHFSTAKETQQCANVAAAAKEAGVKQVVWSTLENSAAEGSCEGLPKIKNGDAEFTIPHFDGKGAGDKHFADAGVPTTFLKTSFYWDNFIHFGMGPKKMGDGFGYQSLNQEAFNGCRDPATAKALYPDIMSFDAFCAANADKIPKE